jgi:hypothetical protein
VIPLADLERYAAALQKQVDGDLAPAWDVRADVTVLAAGDGVPAGTWPLWIVDALSGASGVHLDEQGQPYAEVVNDGQLTITLSHELLEMLVNPLGNRFIPAADLDRESAGLQVNYLVEVADPCDPFSYAVDEVAVCDFVFPAFYDTRSTGLVDQLGELAGPLVLPDGGYISWFDPADQNWHERRPDGVIVIGPQTPTRITRADRDALLRPA